MLRILWLVNIGLPESNRLMGKKISPFGGWLVNASKHLALSNNIKLSIAFPDNKVINYRKIIGEQIDYFPFHRTKAISKESSKQSQIFDNILDEIEPDIVHIHGSELPHTLSMVNICKKRKIKTVISIQGLVSKISEHMYSDLPLHVIYGFTLRNIIRKDSVYLMRKSFQKRGIKEIEALKNVDKIIGRTAWDKSVVSQINPKAKYYFCNETLRDSFYSNNYWDLDGCEKHTIFLSQGQYSIKGLHYMLEAMPIIVEKFPNAKLYVGGKNLIKSSTIKDKMLMTYYGKYIKNMIKKQGLTKHVFFTDILNENEICNKLLKSHVFVCPSSIENSPNSLGEAMILGVPSIASFVGGIPDMLQDKKEGVLYQHNAPYILANHVCSIFEDQNLAARYSEKSRVRALITHNRELNNQRLIDIYNEILYCE